ncbi:MAG TPA: hypothetical protein VMR95_02705 [Candidatus Binatia bacterium]|nr:hypothetical protein [Candidatus Binatia bacterium]
MNTTLQHLVNKEVTRKEFLSLAALAIASIAGIGTILELLTGKHLSTPPASDTQGYSASDYGGKKNL